MKTSMKNIFAYFAGLIINVNNKWKLSMLDSYNAKQKGSIGNARSSVCTRSSHIHQRDHRRRPNAAIHMNTFYAKRAPPYLPPIPPYTSPFAADDDTRRPPAAQPRYRARRIPTGPTWHGRSGEHETEQKWRDSHRRQPRRQVDRH